MGEQDTPTTSALGPLVKQGGPIGILAGAMLLLFNQMGALDTRLDETATTLAVASSDLTEVVDVIDALHPRTASVGLAGGGADEEAARKYKLGQLRKRAGEEAKAEIRQQEILEEIVEQFPEIEKAVEAEVSAEAAIQEVVDPIGDAIGQAEQGGLRWFDPQYDLGLIPDCLGCHDPHPLESMAPR